MKFVLAFLVLILFVSIGQTQTPSLQWVKNFGSTSNDYCRSIAIDNSGNSIIVGDFGQTVDFDPGPGVFNLTSNGHFDFFIWKLDASGNFMWAKSVGAISADQAVAVKLDNSGNIFIAGSFAGTVDFDPGPGTFNLSTGSSSTGESFLLKLDVNGNFLWAKQFAATNLTAIETDASGNIYSTGGFYNVVDFDPGPGIYNLTQYGSLGTGTQDVFVLKLNATGNFIWVKQMGGTQLDQAHGISLDGLGNIITTGWFGGTADFDPGPATTNFSSLGLVDMFVSKLNPNGDYVWARHIGSGLEDYVRDMVTDISGNTYLTGTFYTTLDFDPGPGTYNLTPATTGGDIFVCKLDAAGAFVWAKQFGGAADELCFAITLDNLGNVYTTGYFRNTCDFNPGSGIFNLTANGYQDIFVSKLDNGGNFIWAVAMGSAINFDSGYDIKIDQNRNVYTVGFFWGTVDFDPGPGVHDVTMADYGDAFVQKLSQCANLSYSTLNITACNSYTLNSQLYTSSGTYTQTLLNAAGCDSLITLNLIIGGTTTNISTTACDSYFWEGQTYTTSGLYVATYTGADGCDSIRKLDLIINNSVSTVVNETICEGETYSGYTNSGTYTDSYISSNGCDSIRTLNLVVRPRSYYQFSTIICEGESYWGHSTSGSFNDTLVAANGCDSVRTLQLSVLPVRRTIANITICQGQSYFVGGSDQTMPGIYFDTLMSSIGCDSIISTTLSVNPRPNPGLGADRDICEGSTLQLNPGNFTTYKWQDNSTSNSFTVTAPGLYWVIVTNGPGCSGTDTVEIKNILPAPRNFLKDADSVCRYQPLQLAPIGDYSNYQWSIGSNQPSVWVTEAGQYRLIVQDLKGCYGSDTITIYSKTCPNGVFIPTAFTPNRDGLNDVFKALVHGEVISFQLSVYNRWGERIFASTNHTRGWDGKQKGLDIDPAVFVWTCTYQLSGEKPVFKKGTLTLIR